MMNQSTLVLVKPDGIHKELVGPVLTKLAETSLIIIAAKMLQVSKGLAEEHYGHLKDKPFFGELIQFIMGEFHTPRVMALVYHGPDAVSKVRQKCGATHPENAEPNSIRGSFGRVTTKGIFENVVHASESVEEAEREIKLWFKPEEILNVDR
jgi:nucleoside-diphosphate kinase